VGREGQLAALRALLARSDVRLVTLTGAGGVGKTRLAIAVAAAVSSDFADGVVFVDLAPLRDHETVLATIAAAFGVRETGPWPLLSVLHDQLASRQLVLFLDNFEHLLPAAPLLAELLQAAPEVKGLVTSRQPLRLRGEREFPVPPLKLPPPGAAGPLASEAVTLFVECAQAARFDFVLNEADASAVAEIVTRLDGLPLAIELAAAWARSVPPAALARRMERRLPLLLDGASDAPSRHHTMRDAIAWSYDLLTPQEQTLFRRLSVFEGGFTAEAAEEVDEPDTSAVTFVRLSHLVDQSLVRPVAGNAAQARYRMLETVREFAEDQLKASGEETAIRDRHAEFFLALAERAASHLHGPDQRDWLHDLEVEHDNLRAALGSAIARGNSHRSTKFGALLWMYWLKQGHWTEGRAWLGRVQAAAEAASPHLQAEVLLGAGSLTAIQGHLGEAQELFISSLDMWRNAESASGMARTLSMMSIVAVHGQQFERAASMLTEAIPFFELPKDEPWAAHATGYLGFAMVGLGAIDAGVALAEEGLSRLQAVGEEWAIANALIMLGDILEQKGEHGRAAVLFADALERWSASGLTSIVLWPLVWIARVTMAIGDPVDAVRILGFLDVVAERAGALADPYFQRLVGSIATDARARLGDPLFDSELAAATATPPVRIITESLRIARDLNREQPARQASRGMNVDQAMAEALALSAAFASVGTPPTIASRDGSGLSEREQEVLRLIAAGRSNTEIAAALFISRRTASTHASDILNKLGLDSRAELIAFAHREGLV
jgi:predicted ATPase/DNA-binding CsgD family transcriptional regulator